MVSRRMYVHLYPKYIASFILLLSRRYVECHLECAASGRAAITTKRPGCKETVVDGVTGYLVDEQNKEQVLEAAMKFIELPFSEKQIMGLNARKYMESHFDRNIVINAYHKVIDSLTSIAR